MENNPITLEISVSSSLQKTWNYWNQPEHITQWCFASENWHAPAASNNVQVGGKFSTTMAAKDGSMSFDFSGTYTEVEELEYLAYTLDDGRKVSVQFVSRGGETLIVESFEPENIHPIEFQKEGWMAILENFKKYVEK